MTKAAVGNHVQVQIITRNMLGKHVQYKVWEYDAGKNDLVYESGRIEVKGDIINTSGFTLSKEIFDKGIDFGRFDPDSSSQNYFIEVLPLDVSAESQRFGVTPEALMTVETGKSAAVVREEPRAERKEEKECPNCDKDITLEEIRKICVDTKGNCLIEDDTMIKAALPYLNQYRKKAGINSCVTKAHFLAQISQESKFFQLQERFKYTDPERMRGLFKSYFQQFGSIENQRKEAKRLSDLSLDSKNWEEVANAIYGPAHPIGNASGHGKTDGWRYSGKGFKQITWKDNYNKLQTYVKNNFGLDVKWVDGDNPYKLKWQQADAIISALAYWGKKNISSLAIDTSSKAIENVTLKINSKGEGLDERKRYFKNAVKVLKVNSCKQVENNNLKEKGTVVVVAGKGSKYVSDWLVYETTVYKNITLETFKKLENKEDLPNPDFKLFLSRDAHGDKEKYGKHSDKRYGKANETPPGEYYLIPKISSTQSYKIYISDDGKTPVVNGPHGKRDGLAIHQYNPKYAIGCLTTVSGRDTSKIEELLKHLTDLPLNDDKPVRIIIKERSVKEEKWDNPSVGTTKWTGIL